MVPADPYAREAELAQALHGPVAGIDEVGRGPLAGPVVAVAVILGDARVDGLADSKALEEEERNRLFGEIVAAAAGIGVGWSTTRQVDRWNILRATHRAMARAVQRLPARPVHLLVDGREVPELGEAQTALVGGDALCACISAASIVAKVIRDRYMTRLSRRFPAYGFDRNKGYGTPEHIRALAETGPCPHHRRTFAPVALSNQGVLL